MLQQTQVAVVIPYFEQWMRQFPTITALADAPLSDVIKCWEGLGYYSRARNLHEGAKFLAAHHDGQLPNPLPKLKGLGPYTQGAIRSLAFGEKAPAVDGNVMRVITRYFNLPDDIGKVSTRRKIESLVAEFLPDERPWEVMEGLIELGATVCKKMPDCASCPLTDCSRSTHLPFNSRKTAITQLCRFVAIIESKGHVLLRCGKPGEVMADLYEFPYFDTFTEILTLDLPLTLVGTLSKATHTFTRYRATLFPSQFTAPEPKEIEGYLWHPIASLHNLPFSSGHRKLCKFVKDAREVEE